MEGVFFAAWRERDCRMGAEDLCEGLKFFVNGSGA